MTAVTQDLMMHLPDFPCVECAGAIAQSGISLLYHGSTESLMHVQV